MMRRGLLSLSCVFLAAGRTWCWEHATAEVFETSLATNALVLVAFVAPSEPKSQALEKEWLSAVAGSRSGTLLSIDCENESTWPLSSLCAKYDITSPPFLHLFKDGMPVTRYMGTRRASGILNFMSRMSRPTVTELDSETVEGFKTADETTFISYISSSDDAARQTFAAVAKEYHEEFAFGLVSDDALIKAQNSESPTVVCHVVEDGETRSLDSFSEPQALRNFVLEASRRVIGELLPYEHVQQRLRERGWPIVYVFGETEDDRAELRRTLYKFAKSYYDSLTCVTVDPVEFPDLQEKLGLEPGVFPSGAVHQLSKDRIYPYPRGVPIDSRSLQKWGLDVWQGRIKPWTPPGATTIYEDPGPKAATRKVSVANIPGVNIRVGGRDEL